jgi:diguanylate cyclase (GGDEF)-like protein/PAS domain S-box-containing protein
MISERKLRESEALYRSLVEISTDGISLMDLPGHFLNANQQALEILGFDGFDELQASGLTFFDFVGDHSWLREPESLQSTLLESSPRRVEYNSIRRDGSMIQVDANLALLKNAAQRPYAFLAISRDVSERKRGEDQLRKFSQAVAQSGDNIVITDTEGRIEYVNPQFEQTTGYSLAEVIGKNPRILKSGEQRTEFYRQLWKTIKSGQTWRGEFRNKRKNGSMYWEEVSIAPVVDENGITTHFVAIKKEITEHKQLEQDLRIKDSAIESSINAFTLADLYGRLTYVNPAFLQLWGYTRSSEVIGKSILEFLQEGAPVETIIQTLLVKGAWQGEMVARRKDGSSLALDFSAHRVKDETGKPICLMSTFVDISARKQAEAAEREERRLSDALRKTAEALSSTLKLDDVLELILENAGQVIDNDAMTIMLLDGQNLKVVRHRGYTERGLKDYIENTEFKIEDFPSLALMVETRQPQIIPEIRDTPAWQPRSKVDWIRSYAGVPICKGKQVIGFLNLDSATPNFFTPAHASRLQAFASQAAVAIENARLYEQDHILSITDGLTGLYNSRYFFELAKLEFERSRRYLGSLSVVMIDVDHFKDVNDTYGHMIGDDVLREIARRVRSCLRVVDVAARYGGEEFVILMAQTGQSEACQAAERIRSAVAERPFDVQADRPATITISLGVTTLTLAHQNLDALVKSADDALYNAKFAGRNQLSIWKNELKNT